MSTVHPPQVRIGDQTYRPLLSTDVAASWCGTAPHRLRERIGDPAWPVQPVRVGRLLRWPTLLLARHLGLDAEIVTDTDDEAAA
jgi:hypothetical protein